MANQKIIEQYVSICSSNLEKNPKLIALLKKQGIYERFIFDNFRIGFSDGNILKLIGGNEELIAAFTSNGIIKGDKEIFKNYFIIPILDENKAIVNIAGYNLFPQTKTRSIYLNDEGIFNSAFIKNAEEIIFTENPIESLLLIQNDFPNTTFIMGGDEKYQQFIKENKCKKTTFCYEGNAKLFFELTSNGISSKRVTIDFEQCRNGKAVEYLNGILINPDESKKIALASDTISEIENGFLFRFPHLNYRLIGNFNEYNVKLLANIKAYTESEVFMDRIDLYKNRDRQNFTYNVLDKFHIRDQVQIENDLNQIIAVIEKHREKKENEKKKVRPELTDHQKQTGMKLLTNPKMFDEIDKDYSDLGYIREPKNKLLLYLIMTSRLTNNPLHGIIISRSGAGKSYLAEITEMFCPPEEVESISDLSAQALYYFESLKHKFIVIGEKQGSNGADYPLRELISKKSITKAVPMKDPITGQIKTVSIKVDGPISLIETSTEVKELNPENINRCFIISIDETEEQTVCIHQVQRENYTVDGYQKKQKLNKIINKHLYAQRLLEKIQVFNPYAELLTFPSSKLKTRRDNEKFLRLINIICFLHQFQRKRKKMKLENHEIEYIECTLEDYKMAYDILSDGVLENTLDDLPQQARKLFDFIKKYLQEKSKRDSIPVVKIEFERKEIRMYTSWSFAQIRNNFKILIDYEYIQLIRIKNGMADHYKLNGEFKDLHFMSTILSPDQLKEKINYKNLKKEPEHTRT